MYRVLYYGINVRMRNVCLYVPALELSLSVRNQLRRKFTEKCAHAENMIVPTGGIGCCAHDTHAHTQNAEGGRAR